MVKKRLRAGTSKAEAARRRAAFVSFFLANGGHAKAAAIAAGYSPSGAEACPSRLKHEPAVAAAIAAAAEKAAKIAGLELDRTLREVARVAYSDIGRVYRPDGSLIQVPELDDDTRATVASVEVDAIKRRGKVVGKTTKIKLWNKNDALEKAMKFHGLYAKDNAQNTQNIVIVATLVDQLL